MTRKSDQVSTPELNKQSEIIKSGATQTLTEFYDWLGEQGYRICQYRTFTYRPDPILTPIS